MYPTKKLWEICEIERWWSPRPIKDFLTDEENWVNWIKIWDTKNSFKYIEKTAEKIKSEWVKNQEWFILETLFYLIQWASENLL